MTDPDTRTGTNQLCIYLTSWQSSLLQMCIYRSGTDVTTQSVICEVDSVYVMKASMEELHDVEVVETGSIGIQLFNIIDTTD